MAYSLTKFFAEMVDPAEADQLDRMCRAAGMDEVIDLALLEPAMVPHVLGEDAGDLGPTLLSLAKTAEKSRRGGAGGKT